jgi:hypothetical protein
LLDGVKLLAEGCYRVVFGLAIAAEVVDGVFHGIQTFEDRIQEVSEVGVVLVVGCGGHRGSGEVVVHDDGDVLFRDDVVLGEFSDRRVGDRVVLFRTSGLVSFGWSGQRIGLWEVVKGTDNLCLGNVGITIHTLVTGVSAFFDHLDGASFVTVGTFDGGLGLFEVDVQGG